MSTEIKKYLKKNCIHLDLQLIGAILEVNESRITCKIVEIL